MTIQVVKADKSVETFKPEKLARSLKRAGAPDEEVQKLVDHLSSELYDGIKTEEIYRHAFTLLRNTELPAAARYSLRRALFSLGPTGFPFETYLARLFALDGYTTKTGITITGQCTEHEIDVAAFKEDHCFIAEAKFHARPGIKSDLQVALYSYARLLDLKDQKIKGADCNIQELWVITNTKFTSTAERYASCVGLKLLSWGYPKNGNLYDRIHKARLYPITVLQTLSANHKKILIERGLIACRDIVAKPQQLRHLHVSTSKTEAVLSEARQLCQE